MKISGAGEGLAIARGRVAKYLRFAFFFQSEQKKTQFLYTRYIFLESTHNNLKPE